MKSKSPQPAYKTRGQQLMDSNPTAWLDTRFNRVLAKFKLGVKYLKWRAVRRGDAIVSPCTRGKELIPTLSPADRAASLAAAKREESEEHHRRIDAQRIAPLIAAALALKEAKEEAYRKETELHIARIKAQEEAHKQEPSADDSWTPRCLKYLTDAPQHFKSLADRDRFEGKTDE